MNTHLITALDWLMVPVYILALLIVASYIKKKYIQKNPIYKYFLPGLVVKIIGAIFLCVIYVYYYTVGGDTLSYNNDSSVLLQLFFKRPVDFFEIWLSPLKRETYSFFDSSTGYLMYGHDEKAFMVVRLMTPLKFIAFDSYLVSSILMAALSYTGVWKMYMVFCDYYPFLYKKFAITVLFIPSVVFWGSGMLKDSWTLAAAGWYFYSFYKIFIKRESVLAYAFTIVIASFIMIFIKPYIFIGLLPGTLLWASWNQLNNIKNIFLKVIVAPVVIAGGISIGFFVWYLTSSSLGQYQTIDSMLKKAVDSSMDLKQDYYGGNSFDIGYFEPTLEGLLSKFPIATVTGLFRPYLWEARNVVMLASGFENLFFLFFLLYVFLRKPRVSVKYMFSNPLILFCLIFAIFFAFSVAISTSNFGAMVRLRIPMIPFLLSGLVMIEYLGLTQKKITAQ